MNIDEDRAMEYELNRHLNAEADADRRAERVKQCAADFLQKGELYDPWSFTNFTEAMDTAPEAEQMVMFAAISIARDNDMNNIFCNRDALIAVQGLVERYWEKIAAMRAERLEELNGINT